MLSTSPRLATRPGITPYTAIMNTMRRIRANTNESRPSLTINTVIEGGQSEITGDFTLQEAQDLANVLKSGKMTARVSIISDMVVGPSVVEVAGCSGDVVAVHAGLLCAGFGVDVGAQGHKGEYVFGTAGHFRLLGLVAPGELEVGGQVGAHAKPRTA